LALLSVDAFAGGLFVNSLLSLWLMQRSGLSIGSAGQFFFWTGLLSVGSQLVAPPLSHRIDLLNTMVITHIPSSLCLIGATLTPSLPATLALLLMRSAAIAQCSDSHDSIFRMPKQFNLTKSENSMDWHIV
jgi:hypothetical protein